MFYLRNFLWQSSLQLVFVAFTILFGCNKEEELVFPTVITKPVITSLTDYADCGGIISTDCNVDVTARGLVWGKSADLNLSSAEGISVNGKGTGGFDGQLVHLDVNVLYYVRAYAVTAQKTLLGNLQQFTLVRGASVTTGGTKEVRWSSAILIGYVSPNNSETTLTFQIGNDTNYFEDIIISGIPPVQNTTLILEYKVQNLKPDHTYHYRVKAENYTTTTFGKDSVFKTRKVAYDYDQNPYSVIEIGTQVWFIENLKVTHFADGQTINNSNYTANPPRTWAYNNSENLVNYYGRLYNYNAIVDGLNLCPTGWHVPTRDDLITLQNYIGGPSSGGKLKDIKYESWTSPNTDATNVYDFSAVGGGMRTTSGTFTGMLQNGFWFSTTSSSSILAYAASLSYNSGALNIFSADKGTGYSVRCIKGAVPTVITGIVSELSNESIKVRGQINPNDTESEVFVEYGATTNYGLEKRISNQSFTGNEFINFDTDITGIAPGVLYHYRIKASCSNGVVYGKDLTFTKGCIITSNPIVTSPSSFKIRALANSPIGPINVRFVFGNTTDYTETYIPIDNVVSGSDMRIFEYEITGINPGTVYHFNMIAEGVAGSLIGQDMTFSTDMVTDADGNVYEGVQIGNQIWMKQNLSVTKFSNNDPIPEVTGASAWNALTTPGYCNYNNSNYLWMIYGRLYNWRVATDTRNVCPIGWYPGTYSDYSTLARDHSSGDLREKGLLFWETTDNTITNSTSFSARGGGYRETNGSFLSLRNRGFWWSQDPDILSSKDGLFNVRIDGLILSSWYFNSGFSIRCVKGTKPLAMTSYATNITSTSVMLSAYVNANTEETKIVFYYGKDLTCPDSVMATPDILNGNSSEKVTATITSLTPNTSYYYRIKAVNNGGKTLGLRKSFKTLVAK